MLRNLLAGLQAVARQSGKIVKGGWPNKKLSEACKIKPPKVEARRKLRDSDPVTFAPMANLGADQMYLEANSEKTLGEVSGGYTYFAEGDVLLAKITPCFENGKLGIAEGLTNGIGFGSSEFIVLRPSKELSKKFLYYFLSREAFRKEGAKVMSGAVGHKRVSKGFIEGHPIPLPPLPEQKRIVAILDEAFAGISQAVANAEKNLANARELFDGYLNNIFTHKGNGWEEFQLQELSTKIGSGATPKGGANSYKVEGISLIRSLNVYDRFFTDRKLAFIDENQANKLSNVIVEEGDVLFNITGASVARCCIVPTEYLPARVNQHVSILRPKQDKISSNFLCYLMTSRINKDILLGIGDEGGSTRQAITKKQLQELVVFIPKSIEEQEKVVSRLNELLSKTQCLETIYQQKLSALAELKQSILQKAFAGELTGDAPKELVN